MADSTPLSISPQPRIFGTDGIRDLAGQGRLSQAGVARAGRALARLATDRATGRPRILLGRDPRPSGSQITQQLASIMAAEGAEVVDAGILPSPALAWLTAVEAYDLGCAISASHNPPAWNGIKPFLGRARKLSQAEECEVEALMEALPSGGGLAEGSAPAEDAAAADRYIRGAIETISKGGDLAGLRLVVDLSAGAASATAPAVLKALGIEATFLHAAGSRPINEACGTEHPEAWLDVVRASGADGGLAFDGDADRVLVADETGVLLDGDDLLALLAADRQNNGGLPAATVVSTVMANLGLEQFLSAAGLRLERTPVGDRHVAARMRALGAELGGEQSGHVVLPRHGAAGEAFLVGDGLLAGLSVLQAARRSGGPLSALRNLRARIPQLLVNVRMATRRDLDEWPAFQEALRVEEEALGRAGRFVVRYSGTEPLLRIMAEGADEAAVRRSVEALAEVARAEAS